MKSLWDSVLWLRRKNKQDKEEILTAVNAVQNLFKTSGEATASPADIVAPETAYNGTTLITGTLADKTGTSEYAATASIDNTNKKIKMQVPSDGKYSTKNYLYQTFSNIASLIGLTSAKLLKNNTVLGITGNSNNMDTSSCDAAAAQILSGEKAGVKGNIVTGTMVNRAGTTVQAAAVTQDDDNTYFAVPEAAYYDKNSKIATANSNLGKTSFARFATTNQVYNANSPSGIIPFNNNSFDKTDFALSSDSTAIIVEQSGTYTLDVHINGGNRTTTCLMVNGNIKLGDNSYSSNAGPFTQSYSGILNLNKGDKISIYYRGTSWGGSAQGFVAGSWFSIGKLSSK